MVVVELPTVVLRKLNYRPYRVWVKVKSIIKIRASEEEEGGQPLLGVFARPRSLLPPDCPVLCPCPA